LKKKKKNDKVSANLRRFVTFEKWNQIQQFCIVGIVEPTATRKEKQQTRNSARKPTKNTAKIHCAPIDWHSVFGIEEIRCGRVVDDYNVLQRSTQLAQIFHVISSMTNYAHIANDILLSND
jgi:hypothetical protein